MFARWSLDPGLVYVVLAGGLYLLGGRPRYEPRRALAFFAGLVALVVALDSPIDTYADELLWVHMVQHILLFAVAPPLILLGRPWPTMWRALPVGPRTALARTIAQSRWTLPLRVVGRPVPAWLLFNATFVAWHIPVAYNATLTSGAIHVCEHAMFFFTGLLFWAHVVDPGPLRPRLDWPARGGYLVGAMIVGWVLAVVLVVASHPIYGYYGALASRPGGISAVTDQQIAGGMMWVPGSIPFTIAALIVFARWAAPPATSDTVRHAVTT